MSLGGLANESLKQFLPALIGILFFILFIVVIYVIIKRKK